MKYSEKTIKEFTDELAGSQAVPGGGGAAALAGAAGVAVGNMVASLTIGKKKYADDEEELKALRVRAEEIRDRLLSYIDEDADAFLPLSKCYKMPVETEEQKKEKEKALEECSVEACKVPVKIMEGCCEALEIVSVYSQKGSRLALSDAGCAAIILKSALKAAALNIYVNTKTMKNREVAEAFNCEAERMLDIYGMMADCIYSDIESSLLG